MTPVETKVEGAPVSAPRGSTVISDDDLRQIVRQVAESTVEVFTFQTIYPPVLAELRAQRKYYPGLSPNILWQFYQAIVKVAPIVRKLDMGALWKEYDDLVIRMVNDQEYDRPRMMALARTLKVIGSG